MKLKPGVTLLEECQGDGNLLVRQRYYMFKIRIRLNQGEFVKQPDRCLSHVMDDNLQVHADGYFEHRIKFSRDGLVAGIFYALEGMRVGGYRKVDIAPHLAYKEQGIPGVIPENAKLTVEIHVLREAE